MILRKPYAFLIKNFKKINLLLLLVVAFVFYQNLQIYQFAINYLNYGVYSAEINSVNNYVNFFSYSGLILIIGISGVLAYLLRYKHKPYITYLLIVIANIITLAFFIYTDNYFTFKVIDGFDLVSARIIRDLLLISSLPYYPIIFILLIRTLGIDLKSFGFQEDKEFITNEEDREEVEVQVAFHKDRYFRMIKNKIRISKYFFLEHKVILSIIFGIMLLIAGYNFYHYFYVENRVYHMNQTFISNYYDLNAKAAYLTDKDYTGNVVSEDGKYFIIIDLKINNRLNMSRTFDIEKMLLFVDQDYYVPVVRFNDYFKDMGNLYIGKDIKPLQKTSYILIYEVPKPKANANIMLKYQDVNYKNSKLIRVKIKIQDISTFKDKASSKINEEMKVPLNLEKQEAFTLYDYQLLDSVNYTYKSCGPNSCPIYQGTTSNPDKKIIYLKMKLNNTEKQEFINFIYQYGKIKYMIDSNYYVAPIKDGTSRVYQGNYLYIVVPKEVESASKVELIFTVRTYQYHYILKGE